MAKQMIRIRLKAYDHKVLDQSAERIVETAKRTGAFVSGPVPLPTEINRFCVQRSTNNDKKSREHFEMRTHKRLIDILQASPKTTQPPARLFSLCSFSGVIGPIAVDHHAHQCCFGG